MGPIKRGSGIYARVAVEDFFLFYGLEFFVNDALMRSGWLLVQVVLIQNDAAGKFLK